MSSIKGIGLPLFFLSFFLVPLFPRGDLPSLAKPSKGGGGGSDKAKSPLDELREDPDARTKTRGRKESIKSPYEK